MRLAWLAQHRRALAGGSFAAGLVLLGAGVGVFGGQAMMPNVIAGLGQTLMEIALVVPAVDVLTDLHRRRQWGWAYRTVANALAAVFVDVMRLLYVRSSRLAFEANARRYEELVELAQLHLTDLRSGLASFAGAFDVETHALCRRLDHRMSWLLHRIRTTPASPVEVDSELSLMRDAAGHLRTFMARQHGSPHAADIALVDDVLQGAGAAPGPATTPMDELFLRRLHAQDGILARLGPGTGTIIDDIDNDLAVLYFLLDASLLLGSGRPEDLRIDERYLEQGRG